MAANRMLRRGLALEMVVQAFKSSVSLRALTAGSSVHCAGLVPTLRSVRTACVEITLRKSRSGVALSGGKSSQARLSDDLTSTPPERACQRVKAVSSPPVESSTSGNRGGPAGNTRGTTRRLEGSSVTAFVADGTWIMWVVIGVGLSALRVTFPPIMCEGLDVERAKSRFNAPSRSRTSSSMKITCVYCAWLASNRRSFFALA